MTMGTFLAGVLIAAFGLYCVTTLVRAVRFHMQARRHRRERGEAITLILIAIGGLLAGCAAAPLLVPDPPKPSEPQGVVDSILNAGKSVPGPVGAAATIASVLYGLFKRKQAVEAQQESDAKTIGIDRAFSQGTTASIDKAKVYECLTNAINEKCNNPTKARARVAAVKATERA